MPDYRRNRQAGGSYFFTVNLLERHRNQLLVRLIKTLFSKKIPKIERRSNVRQRRGERGIWQRRYWEHTIRDERDYSTHMDYLHYNPVKHGYVEKVMDWPFSSFRHHVQRGLYTEDWGVGDIDIRAGEPG